MQAGNTNDRQDGWTTGLYETFNEQCLLSASNTGGQQAQAGHSRLALRADLRSMGSPGAGAASAAGVSSTSAPLVTSSLHPQTTSLVCTARSQHGLPSAADLLVKTQPALV